MQLRFAWVRLHHPPNEPARMNPHPLSGTREPSEYAGSVVIRLGIIMGVPGVHRPHNTRLPSLAGWCVAGCGVAVLVGWLADLPPLRGELPGLTAVTPAAAVMHLLAGLALVGQTAGFGRRGRIAGQTTAVLAAGWGLLSAAEYATAGQVPVSAVLARLTGVPFAPIESGWAALQIACIGSAPLVLHARRFARSAEALVLIPLAINFLGLVAVAFRIAAPSGGPTSPLPSLVPYLVLELGLLLARPDRGVMAVLTADDLGGALARRLLPVAVLVPFGGAWVRVVAEGAGLIGKEAGGAVFSLSLVFVQAALALWYAAAVGRTDRERRAAEQALREADRRKDDFLALLAHELRNPLAPIRNGVEILRVTGQATGPAVKTLDMMDRQIRHLAVIIDDLLDVSRITRGRLVLRRERVELAAVVAHAAEAVASQIDRAGHTLALALPDEPVVLDADFTRLVQVIGNLLTNSARYTPPGGRVDVTARVDGGEVVVVVVVADTGVGIPPDSLDRVFDPFAQAGHALDQAGGGLGLGLALVKGLTEMHGGTVTAFSEGEGRGSTFTLRLPVPPVRSNLSGERGTTTPGPRAKARA
jgi:signal transduction histidine kinase